MNARDTGLPDPALVDLAAIAKQRDRHPQGGGAWQRWERIHQICEAYVRERTTEATRG